MIVADEFRKCVAFVGIRTNDGSFWLKGSGFFLGRKPEEGKKESLRFVTARHIIDGIRGKGLTEVYLRWNRTRGDAVWLRSDIVKWFQHPTDMSIDVAMLPCSLPAEYDHVVVPVSRCATQEILRQHEVGLGDEVFIAGLFAYHRGNQQNIPIVRVGNTACLNKEKIQTKDFGEIDAYLIEARSIGGLSGSPVFLNLGMARRVEDKLKESTGGPICFLFGLIHGHYDVSASAVDNTEAKEDGVLTPERVNTGIAIVVPFERIQDVFELSEANETTRS